MIDVLLALGADPSAATLLAGGSSDDVGAGVLFPFLAGPAVFIAVYLGIYRYYGNTGDQRRGSNNRQKSRRMNGANEDDALERVRRIRVP